MQNKPQIGGLAQNPLLLSLICSLYQEKGLTLPARRCQVYEQAVRYMLGKWSKNRNPELDEAWIDAKTELLEELAYQFSCDGKDIFTLRELRRKIDKYLQREDTTSDFRDQTASCLITELSEQDGILQKLHEDGEQYLFLHRTFQEYLTACYLNQASDCIALAREHFWDYEWHETLSLLAGVMKNSIPLLQAITAEEDDIFSTILLLAGRCIAEYEYQATSHLWIIDRTYQLWYSEPFVTLINSTVVALGQASLYMIERLQTGLKDKFLREQAVEVLAKIGTLQAVEALISVLNEETSEGRLHVAIVLSEIGNPQGVQTLISALNHENGNIRLRAAEALEKIGNPQGLQTLISALNDENGNIRLWAAEALEKIGNPQGLQTLIFSLNDKESYVRLRAAMALKEIGSFEGLKALISALKNENSEVRLHVAVVLSKMGNSQAVEVLISALKNESFFERAEAAVVLGEIGNAKAVPALIAALNDENCNVRVRAAWALYKIGSPQGLEALISALKEEDDTRVKSYIFSTLSEIGNLQQVEELLISALSDEDWNVRDKAVYALEKIGTSGTLRKLIQLPEIDIFRYDIFPLIRILAVRASLSKEKLPFIPVYPELVAHKQ